MDFTDPNGFGWVGFFVAMYMMVVQIAWFCAQIGAGAWELYINRVGGQQVDSKVALNETTLTTYLTQQVLTWICITVIMYANRRPYKQSSAYASFFTISSVVMAWLTLQVPYWYNVMRIEQPLYQLYCSDSTQVPTGYCASLKTAAWCSALGFIGLCVLALCALYQVFRARRASQFQMDGVQKFNAAFVLIAFSGYVIWCVCGCVLLTNNNQNISVTNAGWVDVWYTSVPLHLLVIAMIGTSSYTMGDVSEQVAWVSMMCGWAACIGILPVWTYLLDSYLDQNICSNGNGVDCATREGLLAGVGIVALTSWFVAFSLTAFWSRLDAGYAVKSEPAYDGTIQSAEPGKYVSTPTVGAQYGNVTYEFAGPPSSYLPQEAIQPNPQLYTQPMQQA